MNSMTRILLVASAVLATFVATSPGATALSCVGPERVISDADTVFSGRIVGTEHGLLQVEVTDVWRGMVADQVALRAELVGWSEWTPDGSRVADGYTSPVTWVFAPQTHRNGVLTVNPCSSWHADDPETTAALMPIPGAAERLTISEPLEEPTGTGPVDQASTTATNSDNPGTEPAEKGPHLLATGRALALGLGATVGVVVLLRRRRT